MNRDSGGVVLEVWGEPGRDRGEERGGGGENKAIERLKRVVSVGVFGAGKSWGVGRGMDRDRE